MAKMTARKSKELQGATLTGPFLALLAKRSGLLNNIVSYKMRQYFSVRFAYSKRWYVSEKSIKFRISKIVDGEVDEGIIPMHGRRTY